jgi:hypothetical protein
MGMVSNFADRVVKVTIVTKSDTFMAFFLKVSNWVIGGK